MNAVVLVYFEQAWKLVVSHECVELFGKPTDVDWLFKWDNGLVSKYIFACVAYIIITIIISEY